MQKHLLCFSPGPCVMLDPEEYGTEQADRCPREDGVYQVCANMPQTPCPEKDSLWPHAIQEMGPQVAITLQLSPELFQPHWKDRMSPQPYEAPWLRGRKDMIVDYVQSSMPQSRGLKHTL